MIISEYQENFKVAKPLYIDLFGFIDVISLNQVIFSFLPVRVVYKINKKNSIIQGLI